MVVSVPAYFYVRAKAIRAVAALEMSYKTTEPERVDPVNGRPWLVLVNVVGSSLAGPQPEEINRVIGIVQKYGGIVHSENEEE